MSNRSSIYRMMVIHVKQSRVYLEYLLENYSKGMSGKAKTKITNMYNSSKALDDFLDTSFDDIEEKDANYELSAQISEIIRYLVENPDLADSVEKGIIECLKQEGKL